MGVEDQTLSAPGCNVGAILIVNLCSMTIHFGLCKSFCAAEGLVLLEYLIS